MHVYINVFLTCVGSDFERYVVQKFQHLEIKLSIVTEYQKRILNQMSNKVQPEEQEKIDIFQDLPLKNENELQAMEIKLSNNAFYRNEMVNIITLTLKSFLLIRIIIYDCSLRIADPKLILFY